jgi:predicted MFS family arabinose efflux permease
VTGRPARLPWAVYALAAGVVLDLSADTFVVFTVLWIAGPQGWTGAKTALIVVALRLPALAGGWLGGRGVDRFGPKPMMIGQALLRVGCLAALAAGAWSGRFPLVLVLVLGGLSGAMLPIGYAGARTLVPRLLPASQLARGNAWLAVGDQASLIAGAVLVGPLVATVGAGRALLAPAAMLVVAAGLFAFLPTDNSKKRPTSIIPTDNSKKRLPAPGALASLADNSKKRRQAQPPAETAPAGRSPWRSRPVLALLALSFLYYLAYGPVEPALPYFTRQQLHAGPGAYSGLWVVFGIGALAGLSQAPRLTRRRPGVVNAAGATLWAAVTFPLLWCTSVVPAGAVMLVSGAVWGPYLAVEATALQRWVEPAWHGRLFGLQHALLGVASPLGAAAGSLALASVSSRTVLGVAMLGCAVAGVSIGATRAIRRTPAGSGTGTAGSPGPPARAPG